jgi:thiol-disulfide isomerase/thioredoxin
MKKIATLLACLLLSATSFALPLPNGATAPNWTLTDENGETHQLYDYLDQGYTVYIDFFATWCSICWNYKQSNHLKNLYDQYGPNGTDQVRVFAIEGDMSTPQSALYGGSGSQGNWVAGTPYPVIHAPNNTVTSAYQVISFPTVYAICPDRKVYNIGTAPLATLVNWLSSCSLEATGVATPVSCFGGADGSVDLSISGGLGNISYLWSNGATTQDVDNLSPAPYFCTVTDQQNRSITAGPFNVTTPPGIVAFGQATQPACGGPNGALAVSANGGTPPFTYDAGTGPSSNPIITGLAAGNYNVTVADANGCEKIVPVNVPAAIPPNADAGPDMLITCDEPTVILFGGNSETGPNISFQWSTPDGIILNPLQLNPTAAAPGTYILTLTDLTTGCVVSDTALVLADTDVPLVSIAPPGAINCANSEITIAALDLGPCFAYEWTTDDGNIIVVNDNEIIIDAPGTYLLAITNTCTGCMANGSAVVVSATDLEAALSSQTDLLCGGENNGEAVISATGGTTPYAWQWSSGQTDPVVSNLSAGTYTVTVSDSGGCADTLEFEITEPPIIEVILLDLQHASGPGMADGSIDYEITGGVPPYQEIWYKDGDPFPAFDPEALAPGFYEVEVIDANGCKIFSDRFFISETSAVFENGLLESLRVWPNPAETELFIEWIRPMEAGAALILVNALGQVALRQELHAKARQARIELGLSPGWYVLAIEQNGQRSSLQSILIK